MAKGRLTKCSWQKIDYFNPSQHLPAGKDQMPILSLAVNTG